MAIRALTGIVFVVPSSLAPLFIGKRPNEEGRWQWSLPSFRPMSCTREEEVEQSEYHTAATEEPRRALSPEPHSHRSLLISDCHGS